MMRLKIYLTNLNSFFHLESYQPHGKAITFVHRYPKCEYWCMVLFQASLGSGIVSQRLIRS